MWRFLAALIRLPLTIILIPWFILCTLAILASIPIIVPIWIVSFPFVFVAAVFLNNKQMMAAHIAMPNTSTALSFVMIRNLWTKFWRIATGAKLGRDRELDELV